MISAPKFWHQILNLNLTDDLAPYIHRANLWFPLFVMLTFHKFLTTGIGRKMVMALTGLALIGFLITHMAGNLVIFSGAEAYNNYSHKLISNPLIYLAEFILLAFFVGHFINGFIVTYTNKKARPVAYQVKKGANHTSRKSISSSTMIVSGLILLIFVPLHLITFKYGPAYAWAANPEVRDIHRLVMEEFTEVGEVIWYVLAMIVVGFHLWHGFMSAFESLGINHNKKIRCLGHVLATVITGGFVIIPILIFLSGGKL